VTSTLPHDFTALPDLASERLGGAVEHATDEFFAPKEALLREGPAVWKEGEYTDRGKWMDGWETRRHRAPEHDWCEIRLGLPGVIRGVVIDTAFFRGNFPESASLEGLTGDTWVELLPRAALQGDSKNRFEVDCPHRITRLRLHIYPDGGVARLRVHGEPVPDLADLSRRGEFDVAGLEAGARITKVSDAFFSPPFHMLLPDRPRGMHDGWETKRRRGPGHDYAVIELPCPCHVTRVDVDTSYFRGNFPQTCSVAAHDGGHWHTYVDHARLSAHAVHHFHFDHDGVDQLRLDIHPDGGVSRFRAWGTPTRRGWSMLAARALWARLHTPEILMSACGSTRWVDEMLVTRPADLMAGADLAFGKLAREDLLEAFAKHPPIGATTTSAWSAQEQAGMNDAGADTRRRIAEGNATYATRFGHVYLVCATGKSAEELLGILERRLGNSPETELEVAAEELRKITRIRLAKALGLPNPPSWSEG